ncbi:hypothetical protein DCS_04450 [Drechmeria coniospora]|uniref:Uncharacterized protein n=1 Tax=Drechmeria coniospora TaxID=98403 RepID=A0A151GK76_DRECN|nr:hypothetical protein DCS_04450 [Drechmeria coniospora]KYK57441.1 hypothetical protein DCS_04450 [Drechmeria coniospora]
MPRTRRTRARPKIEPIYTGVFPMTTSLLRTPVAREYKLRSASPLSPRTVQASTLDSENVGQHDRGLAAGAPAGSPARVAGMKARLISTRGEREDKDQHGYCSAPLTADSAKSGLSLPRIETLLFHDQPPRSVEGDGPTVPRTAGVGGYGVGGHQMATDPERRQSLPAVTADDRNLGFQRYRELLWRRGFLELGNMGQADVLVVPLELRRSSLISSGRSGLEREGSSPVEAGERLFVRAVIHSKDRAPVGLSREFDLQTLRATIPAPLSPLRSPNFDRSTLLSVVSQGRPLSPSHRSPLSPQSPLPSPGFRRSGARHRGSVTALATASERQHGGPLAMPIRAYHAQPPDPSELTTTDVRYARANLPALAAIMMSNQVRRGDRIDLPMPHPKAWMETVAYVYTGESSLLTERVKGNIVYLGGKV